MADGRTGRLPASVYRRRRLVALLLALLAVALLVALGAWVWKMIGSAVGGDDEPTPPPATGTTPTPTATATGTGNVAPTDAPADAAYPDCAAPTLTVGIQADAADVPAGTAATFTVTITNGGATDCVVDAGEAQREVVVVSGSDRVWSSKDCVPAGAPARTLLLSAGMTDTTQLAWNRERSAPGCPAGQPAPQPGTYQATVSLAGTSGGPTVFVLH